MREVAKAVGIQTASIYYHYESKEVLLREIIGIVDQRAFERYSSMRSIERTMHTGTFEEIVDCIFPLSSDTGRYDLWVKSLRTVHTVLHDHDAAVSAWRNYFINVPAQVVSTSLRALIEKEMVASFDTVKLTRMFVAYLQTVFTEGTMLKCSPPEVIERCRMARGDIADTLDTYRLGRFSQT